MCTNYARVLWNFYCSPTANLDTPKSVGLLSSAKENSNNFIWVSDLTTAVFNCVPQRVYVILFHVQPSSRLLWFCTIDHRKYSSYRNCWKLCFLLCHGCPEKLNDATGNVLNKEKIINWKDLDLNSCFASLYSLFLELISCCKYYSKNVDMIDFCQAYAYQNCKPCCCFPLRKKHFRVEMILVLCVSRSYEYL